MELRVLVHQTRGGENQWKYWFNEYVFNMDDIPDIDQNFHRFLDLFRFHRAINLENTIINCITAHPVGEGQNGATLPAGYAYYYNTWRHSGDREELGETKFMLNLRVDYYRPTGRARRKFYRGCLNEDDIVRNDKGHITLTNMDYWNGLLGVLKNGGENTLFNMMVKGESLFGGLIPGGYERVVAASVGGASEVHGSTRWRHRVEGDGVNLGKKILTQLTLMSDQIERNAQAKHISEEYIHGEEFQRTMTMLSSIEKLNNDIKEFWKKPSKDESEGESHPVSRYGYNIDSIKEAWDKIAKIQPEQVKEVLKKHKPFTGPEGYEYIHWEDLEPFDDFLRSNMQSLSASMYYDWFNPFAYKEQVESADYENKPDYEELF